MNVTHMSNAKSGPDKKFNAFTDFTDVELDSQIIVSSMVHFGMESMEGMHKKILLYRIILKYF